MDAGRSVEQIRRSRIHGSCIVGVVGANDDEIAVNPHGATEEIQGRRRRVVQRAKKLTRHRVEHIRRAGVAGARVVVIGAHDGQRA